MNPHSGQVSSLIMRVSPIASASASTMAADMIRSLVRRSRYPCARHAPSQYRRRVDAWSGSLAPQDAQKRTSGHAFRIARPGCVHQSVPTGRVVAGQHGESLPRRFVRQVRHVGKELVRLSAPATAVLLPSHSSSSSCASPNADVQTMDAPPDPDDAFLRPAGGSGVVGTRPRRGDW